MANDRSIISWDLVLKAKERYEIKQMLVQNYKAMYGADINIDARTADAGWIDALTDILYDFSLLASNTYNSLDITNARGSLLDNLVLLSGNLIRHEELPTKIECQINFGEDSDDNISISSGDAITLTDIENKRWFVRPLNADDTVIYFDGKYPISGSDQIVVLEHSFDGAYFLPEGLNPFLEIRKNGTFITSVGLSINNKKMVQRGTFKETDSQLKARKKESLSYNSTSLVDSIRNAVLSNIYSIADIKIYNSNKGNPLNIPLWNGSESIAGGVTIPLHDIFVLVKPVEGVTITENEAISKALVSILQKKITLGISTMQTSINIIADEALEVGKTYRIETLGDTDWNTVFGTTGITYKVGNLGTVSVAGTGTGTASDPNYHKVTVPVDSVYSTFTEDYRYYIANQYKPYIKINGTYYEDSGFNLTKVKERIRLALYEYAKGYPINKNINKSELSSIAFNAGNQDILNPSFRIDSIDISINTNPPASGANDVIVNNGYWFIDLIDEVDGDPDARILFNISEEV